MHGPRESPPLLTGPTSATRSLPKRGCDLGTRRQWRRRYACSTQPRDVRVMKDGLVPLLSSSHAFGQDEAMDEAVFELHAVILR